MNIQEYIPTDKLRPFIKTYKIIESECELINRVVPSTSFAVAFRLKGKISYISNTGITVLPTTTFSGLRQSVRLINYAPKTSSIIVLFNETGASAFFKQPLYELFEESVSADHFFTKSEIAYLEDCLAETKNNESRISILEKFLFSKLINNKPDKLVNEAIARMYLNNGLLKMKSLANSLFISQDAFEKRFRKVTGATPKQFSSIVRMKTIIQQKSEQSSFLDTALENGFYDQAHFNKEFKIFTGQTPTDFFKSSSHW